MSLVFDIETGPLPESTLRPMFAARYQEPEHPGLFDPQSVKYGNTKDAVKREEKLAAAQCAHQLMVEEHEARCIADQDAKWAEFLNSAALSASTGRVLAIGLYNSESRGFGILSGEESDILAAFWSKYSKTRAANRQMVGHNILGFDLPFLIRRSWVLNLDIPSTVRDGRYFDRLFVDTRELWLLGQRWGECSSSLGDVAGALDCGGKPEGVNGADFSRLWHGSEEERQRAVSYLQNDLEMTARIARRMGVA